MIYRKMFTHPSLMPSTVFADWERMRSQMDRMLDSFWRPEEQRVSANVFPPVNLTEDANHYRIRAELPGIEAKDIDVQVTGKTLSLSGQRKISPAEDGARYHRRERESGKFSRIITLPGDVDGEKTTASLTNGILSVEVTKAEAAKPRQITVN